MRGWRFESYRHGLAARGISTRRYNKMKSVSEWLAVKPTDEEAMVRQRQLESVREESYEDLEQAVADGRITADNASRFWKDDFEPEKQLFVHNGQSMEQFKANVRRKRRTHIERFGTSLHGWNQVFKEGDV